MRIPPRVAVLVPSLARDNDHEIIATGRAIDAALKADGLDFHDLAQAINGTDRPDVVGATSSTTRWPVWSSASWAPGHRARQAQAITTARDGSPRTVPRS